MPDPISESASSARLTAFLRQELQAPATAITDFLDIIVEDARKLGLEHVLADLERMHDASSELNAFVKSVLDDNSFARQVDESFERSIAACATTCAIR